MTLLRPSACASGPAEITSRLDAAIEALLVVLLAFMPLSFGAVEAWSEAVVVGLAGSMALCLALRFLFQPAIRPFRTWAYMPIVLFILLAVFQLVPLPAGIVRILSPNTVATKTSLLGDLPNANEILSYMTVSFYSLATRHDLRLVLVVATVFAVVVNVYRRPEQIRRLLAAVSIIAAGIVLLALAQDLVGNGRIYWVIPTGSDRAGNGPFINHSHFGQFMNLSIGASLGLLFVKIHEAFQGRQISLAAVVQRLDDRDLRVVWCLLGVIVAAAAAVFLSLTRGGAVCLLIAAGFTTLVLAAKRSLEGRGWAMAVIALGAFTCVLYVGFDAVYERLATLQHLHEYRDRWQIVKDVAAAWMKFPLLGAGLGTHEVIYPMFDRSTIPAMASHAENEYAQIAEETGLLGLGTLMLMAGIVWRSYMRCVRHAGAPIRSAAFGLGFGLLAVMLHSFVDFGQHVPANACLTAVCCGLLLSIARAGEPQLHMQAAPSHVTARTMPLAMAGLIGTAAALSWAATGAWNSYVGESSWRAALRMEERLGRMDWAGTNDDYAELIRHTQTAVDSEPGNVKYRHWLGTYRWQSISRVKDPQTGKPVLTPRMLDFTQRIVAELHQTRVVCPTFGATCCLAGQLERFILGRPEGDRHIQMGYALAPCDPTACYAAGLLDALQGRVDDSLGKFKRAVKLNSSLFNDASELYVRRIDRPDLALALAGQDISRLSQLADQLSRQPGQQDLAARARAEAARLTESQCAEPDASAWLLASAAGLNRRQEKYDAAANYYRRALVLDYGQVDWRLALAEVLGKQGRIADAIHEARICLRLRPQMDQARRLIADLSVLPGAGLADH